MFSTPRSTVNKLITSLVHLCLYIAGSCDLIEFEFRFPKVPSIYYAEEIRKT